MTEAKPDESSSNRKILLLGLLLLLGGGTALFVLLRKPAAPPPATPIATAPPTPVTPPAAPPSAPNVGAQLQIPEDEPDAGAPPPPSNNGGHRNVRYVTRYVPACPGTVEGPRVTAVIQANYGALRDCYNRQLRSDPTLRGSVTAEWIIQPNGSVGQIATSGNVARNAAFKTCFQNAITRLRFPPPRGGCAQYQQRFNFTPGGG